MRHSCAISFYHNRIYFQFDPIMTICSTKVEFFLPQGVFDIYYSATVESKI